MRKLFVTILLAVAACAAPSPSPTQKEVRYRNIEEVRSFWGRNVELHHSTGVIDASDSDLKICLIDGALHLTTPEMGAAIERYLVDRTTASLDAFSAAELRVYRNGIIGSEMLLTNGTCASPSQESIRYRDVAGARSFWTRTIELKYSGAGFVYSTDADFKACLVDGVIRLTTPEMGVAIERFTADKTKANMDAFAVAERRTYSNGITESAPYGTVMSECEDKDLSKIFARLERMETRHAFLEEFVRIGSEHRGEPVEFRAPAVVDCIATASESEFSNAYLFAIDRYIADKTRSNWDQIVATDRLAPMSSEADLDKASYACRK